MSGLNTIRVTVEGAEQVRRLNRSLSTFAGVSPKDAVKPVSPGAPTDLKRLSLKSIAESVEHHLKSTVKAGDRIIYTTLRVMNPLVGLIYKTIKTFAGFVLKGAEQFLTLSLRGGALGGAIGAIAGTLSAGFVLKYVVIPVAKLLVGVKALQTSFNWARDVSRANLSAAALAMRDSPGAIGGQAFARTTAEIQGRLISASIIAGEGAGKLVGSLIENFGKFRAQEMETKQDLLRTWGLTRDKIRQMNSRGAIDPERLGDYLIRRRDILIQKAGEVSKGGLDEKMFRRWLEILKDHATELGGPEFAEAVMTYRREDMKRIAEIRQEIEPLGQSLRDTNQDSRDFYIALWPLQEAFKNILRGAFVDAMPSMARTFDTVRKQLLETDANGVTLGRRLRDLLGILTRKAWDTLVELMSRLSPADARESFKAFSNWIENDVLPSTAKIENMIQRLTELLGVSRESMDARMDAEAKRAGISTGDDDRGGGRPQPTAAGPVRLGDLSGNQAVDEALKMEGLHERRDRAAIMQYLRNGGTNLDPATTAWCAAFVNAVLARGGVRGTGSNVARSFTGFGAAVAPGDVRKGDILVVHRGRLTGTGGHVGFATGRVGSDGRIELIGGNTRDRVARDWYYPNQLIIRRPPWGNKKTSAAFQKSAFAAMSGEVGKMKLVSDGDRRRLRSMIAAMAEQDSMAA